MRGRICVVLGLAAVAGLGVGVPSASASAVPPTAASAAAAQGWSARSSDGKGWASGNSSFSESAGLRVTGSLYDARGTRACSWVKVRSLSDKLKYRTVTFRNCSSTPRAFSVRAGYVLKTEAKVCRGTSTRITGKCSGWRLVWRQGG
ncbi:hypothetical protein ACFY05_24470 [Microtetraspora fusca]|uniref:DUF2690 domain-containing protein n=1 Tax=Microtetraspora fusca TaxID=1997 RepID=A0ABW6V9L0_MICFU